MEHQESSFKPLLITLLLTIAGTFLGALLALFVFRALTREKTPKPSLPTTKEPDKLAEGKKLPATIAKSLSGKYQMPPSETNITSNGDGSELDELNAMGQDTTDNDSEE